MTTSDPPFAAPPPEPGLLPPDLVEVAVLDPSIGIDVRYATAANFVGRPLYESARLFLQRPVAEAVVRVHRRLLAVGHALRLFDGYRPWRVTRALWEAAGPHERRYLADPARGSRHNRGCAIDLTLADPRTGDEREMPSGFDEFSERAHVGYEGGPAASRLLRALLIDAMAAEEFTVAPHEWWHFDHRDWNRYPVLDLPFAALG